MNNKRAWKSTVAGFDQGFSVVVGASRARAGDRFQLRSFARRLREAGLNTRLSNTQVLYLNMPDIPLSSCKRDVASPIHSLARSK
jgi:hypothetical protein